MKRFAFATNWGETKNHKPNVDVVSFGDGYEMRAPKGLRHNLRSYDVEFSGVESHIKQIELFLNEHGGYKAFLWTPYQDEEGVFKCEEWKVSKNTGFFTLSATFKEVVA